MDWWTQNKDLITSISIVFGIAITVLGAVWTAIKWGFLHQWQQKLRVDVTVFEVITNPTFLLPKLYATENDDSPLADHNIKYEPRDPNHDLQAELKATLNRSRYLLITAPTGYGKTREAGVLVQAMMLEGWRVLRIKTGWLDIPKTLPEELNNNRSRVLIFLDDLNGLFSIGERTQSPRAERIPLLNESSYHDRLLQALDLLEGMCTKSEIRVIATARNEPDQWKLLGFNTSDKLWKRFQLFELPAPNDNAIINLLDAYTKQLDLKANPDDFKTIARKSDGTYRNILLNLRRWQAQNKEVNGKDFTETLGGSWRDNYEITLKKYPAVKYVYDAIYVLQQAEVSLMPTLVKPVAIAIWGGNVVQRFIHHIEIQIALDYLTGETKILRKAEGILTPSEGQIEATGTRVDWSKFILDIEKSILDLKKIRVSNMDSLVSLLLIQLSNNCLFSEYKEYAIQIWQKIPIDSLYFWFKEIFAGALKQYPGGEAALRYLDEQEDKSIFVDFVKGLLLEMHHLNNQAEIVFRQITSKDPYNAYAYIELGDVLRRLEQYEGAEEAYCQAIVINNNYAYAYSRFGSLLRVLKRYSEAEDAYREALVKDPNDIFTHWRYGALLTMLRRYVDAEAIYRQAMNRDPNNIDTPLIKGDLGSLLRRLGRYSEAEDNLRQALAERPNDADFNRELATLLRNTNREEEALSVLEEVINLDNKNFLHYLNAMSIKKQLGHNIPEEYVKRAHQYIPADSWYNLSCLESICGNLDLALAHLQRAVQNKNFNNEWAWKDPDLQWIRDDPRFEAIVGPKPENKNSEV